MSLFDLLHFSLFLVRIGLGLILILGFILKKVNLRFNLEKLLSIGLMFGLSLLKATNLFSLPVCSMSVENFYGV